jgi:transposase
MLADEPDYVVGVDPHRDAHALAIVQAATGGALFAVEVVAGERGYAQALLLAEREAPGRRAWAIEGTGSYGAGLARFLAGRGERVLEVSRMRRERRSHAKTDALDALLAARSVLGAAQPASPRAAASGKRCGR